MRAKIFVSRGEIGQMRAMRLRVRSITYQTPAINSYELVDPRGRDLPRFSAGAHVALRVAGGPWRDYSLCNDPQERRHYAIAILCERERDGVSRRLHDTLRVGDIVETSLPRNDFPLHEEAERHLFVAGGIGITPILSMIAVLRRRRIPFELHYCTRSLGETAFREDLALLAAQEFVKFHHDGGDPARGLDIAAFLREPCPGTHLYYCGPPGFMATAAAASSHWPPDTVHYEHFSAEVIDPPADARPFRVRLARSGGEVAVGAEESIAEALRRHGIAVKTSCELGYCGTCMTAYLGGEPDHRDQVLDEAGRRRYVMICCARANSPVLELDL